MSSPKLFVVAGIGGGAGTGAASARLFAKQGYKVALIARGGDSLNKLAEDINSNGGEAKAFPISDYQPSSVSSAFDAISQHFGSVPLRAALFNAGHSVWKPFLDITPEEVQTGVETNIIGAFAFSRAVLLRFKEQNIDEKGKRGTLLFTGATASIRGNTTTSQFASGKHALRALSQSLNKEFGKSNIHVAHAIIDGGILTDRSGERFGKDGANNPDIRLSPESIAEAYLYLVGQDRSAWTWELDLRPAHEKW